MVYRNVRGPLPGTMTSWFYKPDPALPTVPTLPDGKVYYNIVWVD